MPAAAIPARRPWLADVICRLLEALGHAAFVFDRQGHLIGETAGLGTFGARESDRSALRRIASAHAAPHPVAGLKPGRREEPGQEVGAATLHLLDGCYAVRRVPLGGVAGHREDAPALVAVVVVRIPGPADDELRQTYGLTPREASVARLIASGLTTPQIAATLGISAHTIRRHSEHVFKKMRVTTRTAVTTLVLGSRAGTDGRANEREK
jgi:DNA-binding CsgD family transcriptional regulator